jgi:ABC-type nitrate/sulfonate/bicarbonate transport system permease component
MTKPPPAKTTPRILAAGSSGESVALGAATVMALTGLWALAAWRAWIAPRFLPPPWRVVTAAQDLDPNLLVHLASTTALVLAGFVIGTVTGLVVGLLMRHSFILRSSLTPLIESWRPVPPVAIVPFFIIWFGFAWAAKVLLVSLGVFLVIVVAVVEAIDRVRPLYLRGALAFGASNWQFLRLAALPAIVPPLLGPLRIGLAVSITLAIISEYMGAEQGIGYVINVAMSTYATHTVLLCAIVLGMLGGVLDKVLRLTHRRVAHWAELTEEALV